MAKKRKRKRRGSGPQSQGPQPNPRAAVTSPEAPARPRRSSKKEGPPLPPWGSFPLSEIVVFVAIVLLIGGFFVAAPRGAVMLGAGLVLGSLAGLELAAREHFSGYRSHTLLLAGAAGIAVIAAMLALVEAPPVVALAAGAAAFGAAAYLLAGAFRRRAGASFRVRP